MIPQGELEYLEAPLVLAIGLWRVNRRVEMLTLYVCLVSELGHDDLVGKSVDPVSYYCDYTPLGRDSHHDQCPPRPLTMLFLYSPSPSAASLNSRDAESEATDLWTNEYIPPSSPVGSLHY